MSRKTLARGAVLASAMVAGSFSVTPVAAQGFFDQLFGARPTPAPVYVAPMPSENAPLPGMYPEDRASSPAPAPRKRVAVEQKPVLQMPTDLMHDKTLHVGDAVMMKDGIHVYNGPEASKHSKKQFVPLDTAERVTASSRIKLAALEAPRDEPVSEGRSSTDIVSGFKITDARGNSIRYVGP